MPKYDYTVHKFMTNGSRWRRPKNRNKKAWRKINSGDIWWDQKALDKRIDPLAYLKNLRWCLRCNKRIALADDGVHLIEHVNRHRSPCPGRNTVTKA